MTTINYNLRLDQELKDSAFAVFESYGLTPSQAIKLFLTQVAQTEPPRLYRRVDCLSQAALSDSLRLS